MTTRERFERKLAAIQARYENLMGEMLDTIENLEDENQQLTEERNELAEQLEIADQAIAA